MMIWSGHKISQSDTNGVGPRLADAGMLQLGLLQKRLHLALLCMWHFRNASHPLELYVDGMIYCIWSMWLYGRRTSSQFKS